MSYLKELQEHYRAVRERIKSRAIQEPKPLLRLTHALQEEVVELDPPNPPKQPKAFKSGVKPEGADAVLITEALREANPQWLASSGEQAIKVAKDILASPRLPPLPGLDLQETGEARWLRVLHAVAAHHNVGVKDIIGSSRKKHIISARFEVFYRLRVDLNYSYPKIASLMKRDHSSVLHGVQKVKTNLLDLLKQNADHVASFAGNHLTAGETHNGQSVASP